MLRYLIIIITLLFNSGICVCQNYNTNKKFKQQDLNFLNNYISKQDVGVLHLPFFITSSLKASKNSKFRILHPYYKDALWNEDKLINFIVEEYNLSKQSSDFEIVSAACFFNKDFRLQINGNALYEFTHKSKTLWAYWSFYSTHCGEHRDRTIHIVSAITKFLNRPKIKTENISLDGHEIFHYFDKDLNKWVIADSDPDTGIVFFKNCSNKLASIWDLKEDLGIIFNPNTIFSDFYWQKDFLSVQIYNYEFYTSIFKNNSRVNFNKSFKYKDSRKIYFKLPKNSSIHFVHNEIKNFVLLNLKRLTKKEYLLGEQALTNNDYKVWEEYLEILATKHDVKKKVLKDWFNNDDISVLSLNKDNDLANDIQKSFMHDINKNINFEKSSEAKLLLPPGEYDESLYIPLSIKNIKPKNKHKSYWINSMEYDNEVFFNLYCTKNMNYLCNQHFNKNKQVMDLKKAIIPKETGGVIITFYFNPMMFDILNQDGFEIITEKGNVEYEFSLKDKKKMYFRILDRLVRSSNSKISL